VEDTKKKSSVMKNCTMPGNNREKSSQGMVESSRISNDCTQKKEQWIGAAQRKKKTNDNR
jgi:hypothetical protein